MAGGLIRTRTARHAKFKEHTLDEEHLQVAKELLANHMGPAHFNEEGWLHILNEHGGMLPISIKSVPEGSVVPVKNVLFTMVNTDPKCFWLTNYLETLMVEVWSVVSANGARASLPALILLEA